MILSKQRRGRATAWWVGCVALFLSVPAWAGYDSGSNGQDGDLILDGLESSVEVQVPPSGVLHYQNISIPEGVTLTFKGNAENTAVVLLAAGDVVIDGSIDVSGGEGTDVSDTYLYVNSQPGVAGPGGFSGGMGTDSGTGGQAGLGPGGGSPSINQSYGYYSSSLTQKFGGFSVPPYGDTSWINLVGGTGRPTGNHYKDKGGGGGGSITIASSGALTVNGDITANSYYERGSAGKIRLIAETITGDGMLYADFDTDGLIKLEYVFFDALSLLTSQLGQHTYPEAVVGLPQAAVPYPENQRPHIKVVSIDNQIPAGNIGRLPPDVAFKSGVGVTVELETEFIPLGTVLKVAMIPAGAAREIVDSTPVTGTFAQGTATATIQVPTGIRVGHVQAWAESIPIPTP